MTQTPAGRALLVIPATFVLATALFVSGVVAQQPPDGWAFGATAYVASWTDESSNDFGTWGGPGLQASLLKPRGLGVDFRAEYVPPIGFYDFRGLTTLASLTYGFPAGAHLFQLKAGGSLMMGGNNDGGGAVVGGPHGGGALTFRVTGRFGIQLETLARVYRSSGQWAFVPSGALTLLLLPRGR